MTPLFRKKNSEFEIIVAGGGISGAAIAYGLAASGRRVAMIDAPTSTNKASRTNVGLIWCQSKFLHLPNYAKWGFQSSRLFPELIRELEEVSNIKVPARFSGGLIACIGEEEYQSRGEYIDKLRDALGEYRGSMISREQLEKKLPHISFGKEVTGAAWCEEDGLVEPLVLLRAYKVAFCNKGGVLIETLINEVEPHGGGYRVHTDRGPMDCERVVLAAGLANRRLAQFAIAKLPVLADKGQVLLIEREPQIMPIPILGLTQTFGGTIIIGFKHEFIGHDTRVVPADLATEGKWAMKIWPELANKKLIRTWSGLRVMPEDKQAIYSRLPGHPRAILINTHSAVTLAAAHTKYLPEYILDGELPETARQMTLKRFGYECG